MNPTEDAYERGARAANWALDSSPLDVDELLLQWSDAEKIYRENGYVLLAEFARGYCDTLHEFKADKGEGRG